MRFRKTLTLLMLAILLALVPLAWAKQKERNDAVCSISQVYVVPADLPHGQFDYFGIKFALEDYTWLEVPDVVILMPKDPPPGTGTVQLTESGNTMYNSRSSSTPYESRGESGYNVIYNFNLMDAKGNVLWKVEDMRELEGVKSSATTYKSEAHEAHADPGSAMQRIAWKLNHDANCGNRPKVKKQPE